MHKAFHPLDCFHDHVQCGWTLLHQPSLDPHRHGTSAVELGQRIDVIVKTLIVFTIIFSPLGVTIAIIPFCVWPPRFLPWWAATTTCYLFASVKATACFMTFIVFRRHTRQTPSENTILWQVALFQSQLFIIAVSCPWKMNVSLQSNEDAKQKRSGKKNKDWQPFLILYQLYPQSLFPPNYETRKPQRRSPCRAGAINRQTRQPPCTAAAMT